ncbi:hypothetical protein BH23CHL5_BH23CHL5_16530 [soil metagenome]
MQESINDKERLASEYPEILVISADISLTRFLTEGLGQSGFWVSAVRSGLQALEVFRLRSFDAIVLDAAIADLALNELIARLHDPVAIDGIGRLSLETPVVLVAGMPSELDDYDLTGLSIAKILVAPFDLEELASELHARTSSHSNLKTRNHSGQ